MFRKSRFEDSRLWFSIWPLCLQYVFIAVTVKGKKSDFTAKGSVGDVAA